MLSGPVVGRLLETLSSRCSPALVVEVGTYAGYSALAMAAALPPGGRVVTLRDRRRTPTSPSATSTPRRTPIASRSRAARRWTSLAALDGPFDLVFIDADKAGYPDYYEAVLPSSRRAG